MATGVEHKRPLEDNESSNSGTVPPAKERKVDEATSITNPTSNITPNSTSNITPNSTSNITPNSTSNITPNSDSSVSSVPQPADLPPGPNLNSVIFGLPKFMDQKKLNKFLAAQQVSCKKAKKTPHQDVAFLFFENMEQKEAATAKLTGVEVKGAKLILQDMKGKPTSGAHNNKGNRGVNNKNSSNNNNSTTNNAASNESQEPLNVNTSTAPLYKLPYAEQLEKKTAHAKDIIKRTVTQIRKDSKHSMLTWLKTTTTFPFEGVRSVPITNKYRNKVQFTIGVDDTGAPCIGFVAGKFLNGQKIMSPEGAVTVPDLAMHVRNAMQEFITTSSLPPYNLVTQQGFWRLLTVKAFSRTNEVMAIVQVKTEGVSPEDVQKEKQRLVHFIDAKKTAGLVITSVMVQEYSGVSNDSPLSIPCLPLWGATHVHERLLNQTFRISPHAFFQTNTNAAEIIYNIVRQWCSPTADSILLDLCCGTGTIGQCLAASVKEVLGIEMSEDAIADAKINAELNGHKNTRYIAGKVEDVLEKSFSTLPSGPIIAVVDPPRAGLHKSVLAAIRSNTFIKRLVYVSCEPQSLISNCSMLCRTQSKKAKGTPFRPMNSVGVDMFPHTDKLEMVVLFERLEEQAPTPTPTVTKIEPPTQLAPTPLDSTPQPDPVPADSAPQLPG